MELKGRAALVTGGSGDLGAAVVVKLARSGCDVVLTYRDQRDRAVAVAREARRLGVRARCLRLDQSRPAEIRTVVRQAIGSLGRLDILVNNAAVNAPIPFTDLDSLDEKIWDLILDVNLRGPFLLARAAAAELRRRGGRVVMVGSTAGTYPTGSSIAYAASKAGLAHLTRCLAVALGPSVAVNCIAPGIIEGTRMQAAIPAEVAAGVRRTAVLSRSAEPEEIAEMVVSMCRADSISGQVLGVDGGVLLHA